MSEFPQRIVCVDDEQDLRSIVKESLRQFNPKLTIVTCGSGKELLARIRELQPDLVFLDLVMPDMNGPDTIEKLREIEDGRDIPVIFLTGQGRFDMIDDYKRLGVIGVLRKPDDMDKIPEKVQELWDAHKNAGEAEKAGAPLSEESAD